MGHIIRIELTAERRTFPQTVRPPQGRPTPMLIVRPVRTSGCESRSIDGAYLQSVNLLIKALQLSNRATLFIRLYAREEHNMGWVGFALKVQII